MTIGRRNYYMDNFNFDYKEMPALDDATEENIKKVDALIDAIGEYYQGSDIISNNASKQ